jgi:hypothetical protein
LLAEHCKAAFLDQKITAETRRRFKNDGRNAMLGAMG